MMISVWASYFCWPPVSSGFLVSNSETYSLLFLLFKSTSPKSIISSLVGGLYACLAFCNFLVSDELFLFSFFISRSLLAAILEVYSISVYINWFLSYCKIAESSLLFSAPWLYWEVVFWLSLVVTLLLCRVSRRGTSLGGEALCLMDLRTGRFEEVSDLSCMDSELSSTYLLLTAEAFLNGELVLFPKTSSRATSSSLTPENLVDLLTTPFSPSIF